MNTSFVLIRFDSIESRSQHERLIQCRKCVEHWHPIQFLAKRKLFKRKPFRVNCFSWGYICVVSWFPQSFRLACLLFVYVISSNHIIILVYSSKLSQNNYINIFLPVNCVAWKTGINSIFSASSDVYKYILFL